MSATRLIVTGGRQTGKTTKLVEFVKEHPNAVLLVADQGRAEYVRRVYGLRKEQVASPATYAGRGLSRDVVFDNAEVWMRHFVGPGDRIAAIAIEGAVPALDDAARIIRGLLYNDDDRPTDEIEAEATRYLCGRPPAGGQR